MLIVARGNPQRLALSDSPVPYSIAWFTQALKKSLKKHHVLENNEKSLKNEKLCDILKNSLNFPQKSLNIFESSLNKNNVC